MSAALLLAAMATSTLTHKLDVEEANLKHVIQTLSAYNTRNTSTPELEKAANWVADQFREIPGLKVELFPYVIHKGPRVPVDKTVVEVVATLPGEVDRRILMGGHLDSINMKADVYTGNAPGANDDLSGVSATIEAARICATRKWRHTLQFVAFTGEEQGLFGSQALAKYAREQGWKIDGVLSNDMISGSSNSLGESDHHRVRVFSEETPQDVHSRELARYIAWLAQAHSGDDIFFNPDDAARMGKPSFKPKLVFRLDRFGRGGDQMSFCREGFPAVRFVEVFEDFTRQHSPNDLEKYVDYDYLRNVARLNILTMSALANAPEPPTAVEVVRDQSQNTTIDWHGIAGQKYVVYWRETTSPVWESAKVATVDETSGQGHFTVSKVNKDDHVFAVGVVGGIPVEAR